MKSLLINNNPDDNVKFIKEENKSYDERIRVESNHIIDNVIGYPPGKLIHVRMKYNNHWNPFTHEKITFCATNATRETFDDIIVSKRFMDHHNIVKV